MPVLPMAPLPAFAQLTRLLVHSDGAAALLGRLHEHLLEACGGAASLVVLVDPTTAHVRASSACKVDYLPLEPWAALPSEQAAVARALSSGRLVPLEFSPNSRAGQLLGTPAGLVVPLGGPEEGCGVVLVGFASPGVVPDDEDRVLAMAAAFVLALERARLRRAGELRREVEAVVNAFRGDTLSRSDVNRSLAAVCRTCARVFVAARATAWLHDRDARELLLVASNEGGHGPQFARVAVVDSISLAAASFRHGPPELASQGGRAEGVPALLIPLRGQRRALGVLELEGVHVEPGDETQVIEAATTLGRHLAAALENVLLFHQVVRTERELAGLMDSLDDLVVICDAELRVVRGTRAFASRAGVLTADLPGRELRDLFGEELESRLHGVAAADSARVPALETEGTMLGSTFTVHANPLDCNEGQPSGLVIILREVTDADYRASVTPKGTTDSADRGH
jgi:GAF domain-containing protein